MARRMGKVAVLRAPLGEFTVEEYPVPEPTAGTLLLEVEFCGICGADIQIYLGNYHGITFPLVMGHEVCGKIVTLGKGLNSDFLGRTVAVGDRVALVPSIHCGKCYFCSVVKTRSKCTNAVWYGFLPSSDRESCFNGGYAQYLYMYNPKTEFFKVDAPADQAVLTEPLAIAIHAVTRAKLLSGQTVVVQGAGPIGLLTVLYCRVAGAGKIIVVDKGRKERLKIAKKFGADVTMDVEEIPNIEDRFELVRKTSLSGYGADAVFECAGVPEVVPEGIGYTRDSGTYCILGNAVDKGTIPLNPCLDILDKNITIHGIYDHAVDHFLRALAIIEKGGFPFSKMISHKIPLSQLTEAMKAFAEKRPLDGKEVLKPVVNPW